MMFNLSVFDTLTDEERRLYNEYKKCKLIIDKENLKEQLLNTVKGLSSIRKIDRKAMYKCSGGNKKDDVRIEKLLAGFENECVRLSESFVYNEENPKDIPLIKELIILDCPGSSEKTEVSWHECILEQIINNGVLVGDEKYIMYSASTNQMKKRQVCLMHEEFLNDNYNRLMCGLSLDIINKNGGCNTGKYMAYTSLIFSRSVEIPFDISIDEVLVLPEFETNVVGKVNYLDMDSMEIEEREMSIPVNHMDGAGMFLPDLLPQSCQIRGGWIKGAIFPFDFRQFIIEKQKDGKLQKTIKDVWGDDVSIDYIRDKIKIVLNGSQLKMWKYYDSWDKYKKAFTENGLKICINNMMHYPTGSDPIVLSAYQFYQTIPRENVTDEKIEALAALTIYKINDAKINPSTALEIMGVGIENEEELDPFYASIKAYPQMLQDSYVRKRIDKKIQSERKKAMSGRPYIKGYYNYICPDMYAACEYWFCGIAEPKGLIRGNHVYNSLYSENNDITEVCCLRSPHLSDCEHGIRQLERSDECKRWFHGLDTVISTHDLLTKTLQCDVDGDEMLLTPDKAFIDLLDRRKLPLYYVMKKAEAKEVDRRNIFECLMRSFKNESIGNISNALTKHLNMAYEIDHNFVRIMTAYNNFCIDYPKSQYMPSLGEYLELYHKWIEQKYPYFFKYAKDKKTEQCCDNPDINMLSNVNRISRYIKQNTKCNKGNIWKENIDGKNFKPQYFIDVDVKVDRQSVTYKSLQDVLVDLKSNDNEDFRKSLNKKYNSTNGKRLGYDVFYFYCNFVIQKIIKENYILTEKIGYRRKSALYLLDIEYFQEENINSNKDILWNCFGDILYENLMYNLKNKPQKISKLKRFAYCKSKELEKETNILIEEAQKELQDKKSVSIMDYEYSWINKLVCRKGSERDRYILYFLLVQHKRKQKYLDSLEEQESITKDNRKHFKIYKKSKYGKVTRGTLDKWLASIDGKRCAVADNGLKRLEKKGLIIMIKCREYDKIYLKLPNEIPNGKEIFSVRGGNPIYDYLLYSGDAKVGKCIICHKPFVVKGNTKTCNPRCSRINELRKKNYVL